MSLFVFLTTYASNYSTSSIILEEFVSECLDIHLIRILIKGLVSLSKF